MEVVTTNGEKSAEAIVLAQAVEGPNSVRHTLDSRGVTCNESRIPDIGAAPVRTGERPKATGERSARHLGGTRQYAGNPFSQDTEPPYAERHVRWCGRTASQIMASLLPDRGRAPKLNSYY